MPSPGGFSAAGGELTLPEEQLLDLRIPTHGEPGLTGLIGPEPQRGGDQ